MAHLEGLLEGLRKSSLEGRVAEHRLMAGFKSWRSYRNFERAVRRDLRYFRSVENKKFLETVLETAAAREITLKKQSIFWRAQVGYHWRKEGQGDEGYETECHYPSQRMKPLLDRAPEGRANPKGIPYLYLATTKETAMTEVRPWTGSYISLAQFKLLRRLKIIDCSHNHGNSHIYYFKEPSTEDIEKAVWTDIDRAFAAPMINSDNMDGYAATQTIAELFKKAGYDGIAYRSNFGENGHNIALFDIDAAELLNCGLHQVDAVKMKFSGADNPSFWNV